MTESREMRKNIFVYKILTELERLVKREWTQLSLQGKQSSIKLISWLSR